MKKLVSLMIIAAMLITAALTLSVSAEEANLLVDMRPRADHTADIQAVSGCEIEYEDDGTAVITLTSFSATVDLTFVSSGAVLYGEEIDVSRGAYVVVDYASADGVVFDGNVQAHYTRKDKEASGTVADLYLTSMEGADYTKYQAAKGKGYVVWDWGTYVSSDAKKVFDNKLHRFTSMHFVLQGAVGKKMYIYKFGIYDGTDIPGLGATRPEPTPEPVESSEEPAPVESSEEPAPAAEGYDFLSTAADAKVNASIAGGSIRVFLPGFNMEDSNTKWSINVLLKKVDNGKYEVVEAPSTPAGEGNWNGTLAEDEILLAVHSDGADANVDGKAAALALQVGDVIEIVYDENTGVITRAFGGDTGEPIEIPSDDPVLVSSEAPSEVESEAESKEESKEESKPAEESAPAAESKEESKDESSGGLGTGAIIGIVVAAVAVVGGAAAVILKKKKQ